MRLFQRRAFLAAVVTISLVVLPAGEARACGGCFHVPGENTEVASHRMVISISQKQSTLWDQIKYSGNPSSFAWVLPVKGTVTIGLSSDALFAQLDALTAVTVYPPPLPPCNCPACDYSCLGYDTSTDTGTDTGTDSGSGVTVVAQMVVGPYETVQLSSTDPAALTTWLTMHGYAIPDDVAPIISAYVGEGFDFLALKLVPGTDVSAMKPVSVTTPGASPVLPLRMVAAGVGAKVPITLFVLGEGRYQPQSFPWFTIDPQNLTWDFGIGESNYGLLRQAGFDLTGGKSWLIESASPTSVYSIQGALDDLAQYDPADSGYADGMGNGAPMAEQADLATLFAGIAPGSLWVTRMFAELPRTELSIDLTLEASADQGVLPIGITAAHYLDPPPCQCSCPCVSTGTPPPGSSSGGGCAVAATRGALSALAAFFIGLGLMGTRRHGRARPKAA